MLNTWFDIESEKEAINRVSKENWRTHLDGRLVFGGEPPKAVQRYVNNNRRSHYFHNCYVFNLIRFIHEHADSPNSICKYELYPDCKNIRFLLVYSIIMFS